MRKPVLTLWTLIGLGLAGLALAADPPKDDAKDKKPDPAADINKPRADARKITFEATEGTWMSVDVSPDGKTIVFDLLGDIYAVPVAGGTATGDHERARRTTRTRASRPTARRSPSRATAAASRTSGSWTPTARTRRPSRPRRTPTCAAPPGRPTATT